MHSLPKPNVVVSRCLGFEACRYNGEALQDKFLKQLEGHVNFLPVCPEMEIGLGTPREPVRIVRGDGNLRLLQPATGLDCTDKMRSFSAKFLNSLK